MLVFNKNELPVLIRKSILSSEEEINNLTGDTVDLLVTLPYLKLLVTKVPAPGVSDNENKVVVELPVMFKVLLSI